ncbi:MAG TPA: tyrosine-type recombinase/integrase [Bryobacteraceae bacterium]|nr:tyrosine-type recombinase/integrase [Bryobacteraceae bacterium]
MVPRTKVLGRCSQMTMGQAESAAAEILRPINAGISQKPVVPLTFGGFARTVYLPVMRKKWKRSTAMTTEPRILFHLVRPLDQRLLSTITREDLQDLLDATATDHAQSVVDHLRWDLRAIFSFAVAERAADRNPATALYTPPAYRTLGVRRELTPDDVTRMLRALDQRERLIVRLAIFEGMRPGEIFALRWRNVGADHIGVEQRVYRGDLDTPKTGKSTRLVGLSLATLQELGEWRELTRDSSPDGFVFPSENLASPLSRDNVWRRSIQTRLEKIGLGWAGFQAMRRANASLSRKAGIDDKVAADQRGHGLGVALEVYATSDLGQKVAAVRKLESSLLQ